MAPEVKKKKKYEKVSFIIHYFLGKFLVSRLVKKLKLKYIHDFNSITALEAFSYLAKEMLPVKFISVT